MASLLSFDKCNYSPSVVHRTVVNFRNSIMLKRSASFTNFSGMVIATSSVCFHLVLSQMNDKSRNIPKISNSCVCIFGHALTLQSFEPIGSRLYICIWSVGIIETSSDNKSFSCKSGSFLNCVVPAQEMTGIHYRMIDFLSKDFKDLS